MRVRVNDPSLLPDLSAYLRDAGCRVEPVSEGEIEASVPTALDERHARMELGVYLAAWSVRFEDAEAKLIDS